MAHWKKRETIFSENGFRLTLPGNWQLRPSDDPDRWFYRSSDRKEQVTLSRIETLGENDDEVKLRRAVARNRRAVELGLGREPEFFLSEPEYEERYGVPAVTYHGQASEGTHYFSALLLFPGESFGWSVFYEAFKLPQREAEARIGTILDSIALR